MDAPNWQHYKISFPLSNRETKREPPRCEVLWGEFGR